MRSTGNIELIITSLVNTKLYICINLASTATPRAKVWFSQWNLTAYVMFVSEIRHGGCMHMEEAFTVENLSKIGHFACIRRKHVAMVESNKHTLWNRLWKSPKKTSNLTEQLIEVSVLIRIAWDSLRGAFNVKLGRYATAFWISEVQNFKQNSL